MRLAALDIGSNTLRLLIAEISNGKLKRLDCRRRVTRLGKDLLKTGLLNQESIEISIRSIAEFKAVCEGYNISNIRAVGTSALRDARDSEFFRKKVKEKTGVEIDVIPGVSEAALTLRGITGQIQMPLTSSSLFIDIGGGSTEIIFCNEECIKASMKVGAVNLFEKYIKNDPPTSRELSNIDHRLEASFSTVLSSINNMHSSCTVVATGGTATTLAAIDMKMSEYNGDKIHGRKLSYDKVKSIFSEFKQLPLSERMKIIGLEAERADIIITGTVIILTIMRLIGAEEFIVSDFGLLEGLLLNMAGIP